jgi:signal transduction histidine kinase
VPADVPLDEPAGRVTDDRPDPWDRHFRSFETIFVISGLSVLVLVWYSGVESGVTGRAAATALLLGLAAWWALYGRRLARAGVEDHRGTVYLVGVVLLFAPAVLLTPDCSWLLFGLCPQPYMVRPHRRALGWVTVLNLLSPLSVYIHGGAGPSFTVELVVAAAAIMFSFFIGNTISAISRENEQRARLIDELRASRSTVAQLSREAGVTAERERLAGEIHDTLAQGFTSILTLVQAATAVLRTDPDQAEEHLRLATDTARENLGEARALVGALTPAALGSATLVDALRRQADRVAAESGMRIVVTARCDVGALAMPVEVVLLRTAQEALANVRKHSAAASASVCLEADDRTVRLVVADDGVGFDPDAPSTGYGLRGMRARAEQIGGSVTVDTGSSGTAVRVEVPR